VDLYRIRSADEALRMGLEEYLHADGLTVIEWAERAAELLPDDTLHVRFEPLEAPDDRRITLRHRGPPLLAVSRPDGRAAPAGAPG
jgi:tRNA threonylcarbamoyladenosine biosynthesis protein TsaE